MTGELAIHVTGLAKSFGELKAVHDLSIDVPVGTIYGFLGPNGSGKTTTIRMLCGLLTPDAGEGTCLGFDIRRDTVKIKSEVGYMPQRFGLYEDLTIRENLEFIARLYAMPNARESAREAIARLGLEKRAQQLAGQLSGGWKQRLALAGCVLHKPRLLLLDEPTAGVDPKARREFWDEIHGLAGGGITVLVSTHYMDEAERCHLIGYISQGKLLAHGTVEEVVHAAGISAWRITGPSVGRLTERIKKLPGVEMAALFGAELHVSGVDAAMIEKSLDELKGEAGLEIERVPPSLEDVFIHTMDVAQQERQ
ncbi:MAG: ATP-binding cassette domain-containing protein [Stellaceae bacterium]